MGCTMVAELVEAKPRPYTATGVPYTTHIISSTNRFTNLSPYRELLFTSSLLKINVRRGLVQLMYCFCYLEDIVPKHYSIDSFKLELNPKLKLCCCFVCKGIIRGPVQLKLCECCFCLGCTVGRNR